MGLFKNDAMARGSPFRNGALKTESDVVEVVFSWVHWYNCDRLHSSLGHRTPEVFEQTYYDEIFRLVTRRGRTQDGGMISGTVQTSPKTKSTNSCSLAAASTKACSPNRTGPPCIRNWPKSAPT